MLATKLAKVSRLAPADSDSRHSSSPRDLHPPMGGLSVALHRIQQGAEIPSTREAKYGGSSPEKRSMLDNGFSEIEQRDMHMLLTPHHVGNRLGMLPNPFDSLSPMEQIGCSSRERTLSCELAARSEPMAVPAGNRSMSESQGGGYVPLLPSASAGQFPAPGSGNTLLPQSFGSPVQPSHLRRAQLSVSQKGTPVAGTVCDLSDGLTSGLTVSVGEFGSIPQLYAERAGENAAVSPAGSEADVPKGNTITAMNRCRTNAAVDFNHLLPSSSYRISCFNSQIDPLVGIFSELCVQEYL